MDDKHYKAIIIGSGQGGTPLAQTFAGKDLTTALIERSHIGGTCINEGCTPTKTMVASAKIAYYAKRSSDYGVNTGNVSIDLKKIRERKRAKVKTFREGSENRLTDIPNLTLYMGIASFIGKKSISVKRNDGSIENLTADRIFINAGTSPFIPPIEGLDEVSYLDSTSIMELADVPKHLAIIGGGYIGLEFGQMFQRFGSKVTIIQLKDSIIPREDDDIIQELTKILKEDGIDILLNAKTKTVSQKDEGEIHITIDTPDSEKSISASHLLVATGRKPNTKELNLHEAGIKTNDKGFIVVNNKLQTSVESVYAMGDIKGPPFFTHISYDDYRIIRDNLLKDKTASIKNRLVPYTIYTHPQLGKFGLSEKEAKKHGIKYKVAKMPMEYVARALEIDEPRGIMKAIIDDDTDQILGCAILGEEGGEIMSMIQIAMLGKIPYTLLKEGNFAHPTFAESLNTLFSMIE
jgi:pyruvate/2-oxoglutarate dehydrogenase complex dihydrolipoamide dehydrogenase (E3) component